MASVTVVKTIGTTGVFSTPQLWEDGAPVDLTTAEKSAATTFQVAAFIQGESLNFVGSGATGKLLDTDSTGAGNGTYVTYGITAGNPAASDVVTGVTSGATCVLTSGTADNVGVIWQGQCQNQEFSAAPVLTVAGSTASATAYKHLTTAAGASFRDNANVQTNALRYTAANGAAFSNALNSTTVAASEGFFLMSGLQVNQGSTLGRTIDATGANQTFEFCIFEGAYTGTGTDVAAFRFSNSSQKILNCLFVMTASGADRIVHTQNGSPTFVNCTFAAADDLATAPSIILRSRDSGTVTVKNCGLFAGDSTKSIKFTVSSTVHNFTTCHSDISGTTGVTQVTYSNQFQNVNNATRDFRLKSGAGMIDSGTTDTTNAPIDIAGTARPSGAAYDTGAWEFVQAAGSIASSTGAAAVSGVGASNAASSGTVSGASTATATGASTAASVASASGTSTVAGSGASTVEAVGTAAGTSTVSGVGTSTGGGSVASASGASTVTGAGAATAASIASAAGASTVSAAGAALASGVGASAGLSTVSGIGASTAEGVGQSSGTSIVSGIGASTARTTAAAAGSGTAAATGASAASATANAAGSSTAAAISNAVAIESYVAQFRIPADARSFRIPADARSFKILRAA